MALQMKVDILEADIGKHFHEAKRSLRRDQAANDLRDATLKAWHAACDYVEENFDFDRNHNRNLAMFLHFMRDTSFHPNDLIVFFHCMPKIDNYVGGEFSYPDWVASDAIIFDHVSARREVDSRPGLFQKIQDFRLDYERYAKEEPTRSRIEGFLQLTLTENTGKIRQPWIMSFEHHLADLLRLPGLGAIANSIQTGESRDRTLQLWKATRSTVCREVVSLQDQCQLLGTASASRSAERACSGPGVREVWHSVDPKIHSRQSPMASLPHESELVAFAFSCRRCNSKYLFYPEIFSHSCFTKLADSPDYSDELWRSIWTEKTRSSPLDLKHLKYEEVTTLKLRVVLAAAHRESELPNGFPALQGLHGNFQCMDCSEHDAKDDRDRYDMRTGEIIHLPAPRLDLSRMSWKQAAMHVLEVTTHGHRKGKIQVLSHANLLYSTDRGPDKDDYEDGNTGTASEGGTSDESDEEWW